MPLISPERPPGGWGSLRDWLRMCKAKAVRSSWEFVVVVGLNFLFCFSPTTGVRAAGPSGHSGSFKDCGSLGGAGTSGDAY